jgi:hypothetical protein
MGCRNDYFRERPSFLGGRLVSRERHPQGLAEQR